MLKMKRTIAVLLAVSLVLIMTCGMAGASVKASDYLAKYAAALIPTTTGQYDIYYDVTATNTSSSLGVSKIVIYRSDGTYITTVLGSTSNGLVVENTFSHTGVYRGYGVSGNSYYAVVTIFAARNGGSDSRDIVTNTITVP